VLGRAAAQSMQVAIEKFSASSTRFRDAVSGRGIPLYLRLSKPLNF